MSETDSAFDQPSFGVSRANLICVTPPWSCCQTASARPAASIATSGFADELMRSDTAAAAANVPPLTMREYQMLVQSLSTCCHTATAEPWPGSEAMRGT